MTIRMLLGSNNAHKIQEMTEIFAMHAARIAVLAPRDLGINLEPDESAATYLGNAQIKAREFFGRMAALPAARRPAWVLADDSGLEVDALGGRPGVLSARYHRQAAGGDGCAALLAELVGVADARRTARFQAVLVLIDATGREHVCTGTCEGRISHDVRGRGGFGFDPVFLVGSADRTMAELSAAEKHHVSHRGLAGAGVAAIVRGRDRP